MFRKTQKEIQLSMFSSPVALLSGRSKNIYEKEDAWHNIFRKEVTMRINEDIFKNLFCQDNGSPNASVRVLVAMMVLKEAQGISDEKLYEECRFNMLTRSAIGLMSIDDEVPAVSTYYAFRKRIYENTKAGNEDLLSKVFADITRQQSCEFNVSGKSVRMDSKLLGSNIAWLSRYELVHETLRLFYKEVKDSNRLSQGLKEQLNEILKIKGNKIVYTNTSEEVETKLHQLGILIYQLLPVFEACGLSSYNTLKKVFQEQFTTSTESHIVPREKEEISAHSIQSPHDTDCHFRNKGGEKVKGYSINVTESCNDTGLNLIGNVDVRVASTPDTAFFQDDINKVEPVFTEPVEDVHADGAYHSPDNQDFCKMKNINLYLHAIQGTKGRYEFTFTDDGNLNVFDTITKNTLTATKIIAKNKAEKWRIPSEKGYRYFSQKEIEAYFFRKKIEGTPIEISQKRNNVEATIFQLGYHYPNNKSRYRGLIKHTMWANMRCLWINFVRIFKFIAQKCQKTCFLIKKSFFVSFLMQKFMFKIFFEHYYRKFYLYPKNIFF